MTAAVHPTSIVERGAELGTDVEIGPFCHIGPKVRLDDGVRLVSHVSISGRTHIGKRTIIYPFAVIGSPPQALRYQGEDSALVVGEDCTIREHATMNPGTAFGHMITRVGNGCLFMTATHVAHDCVVGNNVVMANNATLGGHVEIGDYAYLGGLCAVHQFVRVGAHAMIGGCTGVDQDVIPYGSVMGDRGKLCGLNVVGLKRRGFSRDTIHALRNAYRLLFAAEGTLAERVGDVAELFHDTSPVMDIIAFIRADSNRTICQPRG